MWIFPNQGLALGKAQIPAVARTYTRRAWSVSMVFDRHHSRAQTVNQAEKPGAPESETEKKKEGKRVRH